MRLSHGRGGAASDETQIGRLVRFPSEGRKYVEDCRTCHAMNHRGISYARGCNGWAVRASDLIGKDAVAGDDRAGGAPGG